MTLPPETLIRIAKAIIELTQDEMEAVKIIYPNHDFDGPNNIIFWSRWGDHEFVDKQFEGDSLVECLEKAVEARKCIS